MVNWSQSSVRFTGGGDYSIAPSIEDREPSPLDLPEPAYSPSNKGSSSGQYGFDRLTLSGDQTTDNLSGGTYISNNAPSYTSHIKKGGGTATIYCKDSRGLSRGLERYCGLKSGSLESFDIFKTGTKGAKVMLRGVGGQDLIVDGKNLSAEIQDIENADLAKWLNEKRLLALHSQKRSRGVV